MTRSLVDTVNKYFGVHQEEDDNIIITPEEFLAGKVPKPEKTVAPSEDEEIQRLKNLTKPILQIKEKQYDLVYEMEKKLDELIADSGILDERITIDKELVKIHNRKGFRDTYSLNTRFNPIYHE